LKSEITVKGKNGNSIKEQLKKWQRKENGNGQQKIGKPEN